LGRVGTARDKLVTEFHGGECARVDPAESRTGERGFHQRRRFALAEVVEVVVEFVYLAADFIVDERDDVGGRFDFTESCSSGGLRRVGESDGGDAGEGEQERGPGVQDYFHRGGLVARSYCSRYAKCLIEIVSAF